MPLSEQEQRLLDEMERNLYRNDADFVSTAGDRRGRPSYRNIAIGALVAIVGIGVLLAGVVVQQPVVGILGFMMMLGGVLLAIAPSKKGAIPSRSSSTGSARKQKSSGGFMDRMNDRWERRQDEE